MESQIILGFHFFLMKIIFLDFHPNYAKKIRLYRLNVFSEQISKMATLFFCRFFRVFLPQKNTQNKFPTLSSTMVGQLYLAARGIFR